MNPTTIFFADKIFTGHGWLEDHAVVVENGIITKTISQREIKKETDVQRFDECFLVPAFIDLQIYGAYGKLLAVYPEADSLFKLNEYCTKGGAAFFLPTVATNTIDVFYKCIDAIKEYWNKGGEGVLGLHLEGPWINAIKRGAHIEKLIHSPSVKEAEDILNYGKGVIKMITLAPEICSKEVIELILSHNIIISAGHSNATYKEATDAFESGIKTVTHLYNAMSSLQHREPGLVGATMNHDSVMSSIIPDGYHVDFAAISIAKKIMKERLFAITDAVTETTDGYYKHELAGDKYEAASILSGSALTMNKAMLNLMNHAGIDLDEAIRMCSLYPAQVIGMDDRLGKIETGYSSKLLVLDKQYKAVKIVS